MKTIPLFKTYSSFSGCVLALLLASAISAYAAPPDFTNGGVPTTLTNSNLGPTGLRGWMYHVNEDSSQSRQILVQELIAGSPAVGIVEVGDVILGANGTGANPVNFTADARKSFANAINDAEARTPALLKVLRWRAGTTTTQTLTLRTMGAYSATAPYNCPKSAKILEEGLAAVFTAGNAGTHSLGTLALLAGNNPANPNNAARQTLAQTQARALIPDAATMARMNSGDLDELGPNAFDPWQQGHELIVLTEYYLRTNDAQVLPAINAISKCIIAGQNLFGTYSHRYASKWRDGSPNGPMRNYYGTVNSCSMLGWLGLLLTRECGVVNPDLAPAIARASRFYGYYAGKGAIPYGEHEPYTGSHESNGKNGLAALCFELESSRTVEQKMFAKMAVAATSERELGHTGAYFNHLWAPLGAAAGGETAAASHFSRIRWMLDLNRRHDGTFAYDCLNSSEWNQNFTEWYGFNRSTPALLLYALPLRQVHVTGRGHDSQRWLSTGDVADAAAADGYVGTDRSTSQLVNDLGSWSCRVQSHAAAELGKRPSETTALLPTLHAMATDLQGTSRVGACYALGEIGHASSAGILASLLTDPVNHVRYAATVGMLKMPQSARQPHLNTVLAAAASTSAPLLPYNAEDPAQLTHAKLGPLLFDAEGMVPADFSGVDKNLLHPAVRAIAKNPVGRCRSTVGRIYNSLNQTDYHELADVVVFSAFELTPADKMFAYGDRYAAQRLLEKFNAAEGVPISLVAAQDQMYGSVTPDSFNVLQLYAGGCKTVRPEPGIEAAMNFFIQAGTNVAEAQAVLAAIAGDPNPAPLVPLKSIQSVVADNPGLTLPANSTTLRTTSIDYAKGDSVYTWRKVQGAGNVSFTPNGTADSKNTAVLFDGTPGHYLFEVKMSDSKKFTEVYSTVAVSLNDPNAANNPPVTNSQSPTVPQGTATPITLTGSDPEGYTLSYSVTSQPAHGTLTGSAPNLVYTSNSNYAGPDSFIFKVTDSQGQVATATVNIIVTAISILPALTGDAVTTANYFYATNEVDGYTFTVGAADINVSWLGWYDAPNDGAGSIGDGFIGEVKVGLWEANGTLLAQTTLDAGTVGTVMSGSFRGRNITPVILSAGMTYTIGGYGAGGNRIHAIGATTGFGVNGITMGGGVYGYSWPAMPNSGWYFLIGPNFSYSNLINDTSSPTPSPMTWASVPTATDSASIIMTATTATDPSGVEYFFDETSGNTGGTDSGWQNSPTYTDSGLNPSTTYSYTVIARDKCAAQNSTSVSVSVSARTPTVTGINEIPVATAQSVSTVEDSAKAITLAGTDVEGSALTYTIVTPPANGTLSGTSPNLTYTPAANYNGPDSFTFKVNDGTVDSALATVSITVPPVNDAPVFTTNPIVAAGASESLAYTGQTLAGKATDVDAGATITYSKVSGPAWLVVASNGDLSGTPPSGSAGLNSFVVSATDNASSTADTTLQITVTVLPLPWTSANIGTGMLAGSATFNAGTFTQAGSGIIGSTSDKLRFSYQTLTGDGEIIAKISALQNTGTASRVGVMIRDSLSANSKQIFMGMSGTNAYRWVRRTTTGGTTTTTNSSSGTVPNTWVRLVRSGTTITAYKSTNGTSWTTVGSTTNTTFASTCYIGLAVGSGSNTTLNTSQFSNVSVPP